MYDIIRLYEVNVCWEVPKVKQFDKIKLEVGNCQSSMELAGFLEGIRVAASVYCKHNCPNEVMISNGGKLEDISIYGMVEFLESET
jgi:hypothetical protein